MDSQLRSIAFLGAGNMAEALMSGIRSASQLKEVTLIAFDIDSKRTDYLQDKFNIKVAKNLDEAIKEADIIILAVKPQNLKEISPTLGTSLTDDKCVISIAAGVRASTIESLSGKELRLIRVMPNMAALVQSAFSGIYASKKASKKDIEIATLIFSTIGKTFLVDSEDQLDAVTALSGSGPAYFFYFIEALQESGEKFGFTPELVKNLVYQTALGSLKLLEAMDETPEQLRSKVTSPGGTTEAAINILEKNRFKPLVNQALEAAFKRAQELSKE